MNGITHKIGGACTGLIAASFIPETTPIIYGIVTASAVTGSLFPDIDEPNSIIGQKVKPASWVMKHTLGHRGIMHTPFNAIILGGLIYFLHLNYAAGWINNLDYLKTPWMLYICIGFIVGYISHIFLDTITPSGIMLLYPLSKKKIHFIGIKGRFRDFIISTIMIIGTIAFFVNKYNVIDIIKSIIS